MGGKPVVDAIVTFSPVAGDVSAFGRTDAEGRFALTTFDFEDGAPAGEYQVVIQGYEPQKPTGSPEGEEYTPPSGPAPPPAKLLTPIQYITPQTTPLKATISLKQPNQFNFELTK